MDVDIDKIFVTIPLLKRIKEEDDASEQRQGVSGSSLENLKTTEASQRVNSTSLSSTKKQPFTDRIVSIVNLLADVKRFVIIGDPGSGKSQIIRYIAWYLSGLNRTTTDLPAWLLPIPIRLRDWEENWKENKTDLITFLSSQFQSEGMPSTEMWRVWLERGELFLLLDGLDEVGIDFDNTIAQLIGPGGVATKCRVIVTCRTLSRNRLDKIAPGLAVYTPAPFYRSEQEDYIRKYQQVTGRTFSNQMLDELQQAGYASLAENPLLLSILCFVASIRGANPVPTPRTSLYHEAVNEILTKIMNPECTYKKLTVDEKRKILEELALRMYLRPTNRNLCSSTEAESYLEEIIPQCLKNYRFPNAIPITEIRELLHDLRQYSRIFTGTDGGTHEFFHTTIQEFLVASALARRTQIWHKIAQWSSTDWMGAFNRIDSVEETEGDTYKALIRNPGELSGEERLLKLLDHHACQDEWHEIFRFLTGSLQNPVPLLELLSDHHAVRDDDYRHRLALAAVCLQDINPTLRGPSSPAI